MSAFHGEAVGSLASRQVGPQGSGDQPREKDISDLFRTFILQFGDGIYRDQLVSNYSKHDYSLQVNMQHILAWSPSQSPMYDLHFHLRQSPSVLLPLFDNGAKSALQYSFKDIPPHVSIQVTLTGLPDIQSVTDLQSSDMNKLVVVEGIVISAIKPQLKAVNLKIKCRNCDYRMSLQPETITAYSNILLPVTCPGSSQRTADSPPCPANSFDILADESSYIDIQELKLQQSPEDVPSGEIPRTIKLSCTRALVNAIKPGTRVSVIGIYSTSKSRLNGEKSGVDYHVPYLSVVGLHSMSSTSDIVQGIISSQDEQDLHALVQQGNIYHRIASSVAPAILGRDDIKKAIACSLFGGTSKDLNDGMRLRGDINVLLLGDPSVAKSQFLKFASQVAPISVYTSGKGSSAAGLTASVVRSATTGDFNLEAGALVLADGGVVCIDEFDKMRDQDRVAIHEAMEQQTISIAKAGITTILNSRCSVIAAANPVFGRYDDMKDASENIDFQATILSRFDLIFMIRDTQDGGLDERLADHMINVHKHGDKAKDINSHAIPSTDQTIPPDQLKKLIAFSRRFKPVLSPEGCESLHSSYLGFRKKATNGSVIPITVRQLEAIIRISESIARMNLSDIVTSEHVQEAVRLFTVSTIEASSSTKSSLNDASVNAQTLSDCEQRIYNILANHSTGYPRASLLQSLIVQGYSDALIRASLKHLMRTGLVTSLQKNTWLVWNQAQ